MPQWALPVLDGASDDGGVGLVEVCRRLGGDRDAVVAERRPKLFGDRRRQVLRIELPDDRPRDLAQDRELGDPERLFRGLAPRRLLELAGLGREMPHLLHQPGDLPARAELVVDDEHRRERGGDRRAHEVASGSVTRKWSSCRPCRIVNWPPTASTRRWLTAGPTSIRLSWTICTGSKTRWSFSGITAAVREPIKIRTLSPTSRSEWRATETDTRA